MKDKEYIDKQEFYIDFPIYKRVDISSISETFIYELLSGNFTIDAYCISCGKNSTFKTIPRFTKDENEYLLNHYHELFDNVQEISLLKNYTGMKTMGGNEKKDYKDKSFIVKFHCTRNTEHELVYLIMIMDNHIQKVGQFPSFEDLKEYDYKKYNKILDKIRIEELKKALRCYAHGYGIGAYAYLRRIFEDQIITTFKKNETELEIAESDFKRLDMDIKIEKLKNYLPDLLVKEKSLYKILSAGIHELSEEICLKHFDTIRIGFELILNQKLDIEEKKDREKEFNISKNKIHQDISKRN